MTIASQSVTLTPPVDLSNALQNLRDQDGVTLRKRTEQRPTLVCLLRHTGCTFCRETIATLAEQQPAIESRGYGIAVVGMSPDAAPLAELGVRFGLSGVAWVADPERLLYRALHVGRGTFWQLLGPRVVVGGILGLLRGYGIGRPVGDTFQMPGTAIIHQGRVVRQYIHKNAADRPDFSEMACSITSGR